MTTTLKLGEKMKTIPKNWQQVNLYDIFTDKEVKHLTKILDDREKIETFLKTKMSKIDEVTGQENDLSFWVYYIRWILNT